MREMKHALRIGAVLAALGLAGCVSGGRQAQDDGAACRAQGLSPSTPAFDDCMALASADRPDADRRQFDRMQGSVNMQMDSFMHSSATSF